MEKYVSKTVAINKPDHIIYTALSDFNNFTPILQDKVEDWKVEGETCSFRIKGMAAKMRMLDKEASKMIKITGEEGSPLPFFFWIQLKNVSEADTRLRLTLHVELNTMLKMMLGKKLESGIDKMADHIAQTFNHL